MQIVLSRLTRFLVNQRTREAEQGGARGHMREEYLSMRFLQKARRGIPRRQNDDDGDVLSETDSGARGMTKERNWRNAPVPST